MRNPLSITLMLALAAAMTAPAALAQVARVNGNAIPQARADVLLKEVLSQGQKDTPELRAMIRQELISREVMAQEAVRLGLNKTPEVSMQLDMARQDILIRAYLNDAQRKTQVPDDMLRKAHERFKDSPAANEYRARHILVGSEAEARDIIKEIRGGADFAKIAAARSRDEGTKATGGELGWAAPNTYVRPFAEALARMKRGELTESPVQTNFGWHVIRLEDTRPLNFEAIKPQLQQVVQREIIQKQIDDLRAKAKIE
jgi:peptidyl-prolyl cis-trans isomerase C